MWRLIVFSVISSVSTYGNLEIESRIVGGEDTNSGEFPFAVSLRQNDIHICGGTILNSRYILTAAHCLCDNKGSEENSQQFSVRYGSRTISAKEEGSVPVSEIICNEFTLNETNVMNDIAIAKLSQDLPDDDNRWKPVKLAKHFDTSKGSTGMVIGWGLTEPEGQYSKILQQLEVNIYNDSICGAVYNTEQQICSGSTTGGSCSGDSGSALLTLDNIQIGVASFVTTTCGISSNSTPNVYSRIDYFYPWILKIARYVFVASVTQN